LESTRPETGPPKPSAVESVKAAASATQPFVEQEPVLPLGSGPRIVIDHREQPGGVARHLHQLGAQLEPRQLEVGDYVLSDRVVVERKSAEDFLQSLIDGRLFDQLKALKSYPRPFVVIEGDGLYNAGRGLSPEAIAGAVASIAVDHGIPILQTRDALETARFLAGVAKREQQRDNRKIALRPGKPLADEDRQLFLIAGLPGVSDVLARRLLDRFGSVAGVFAAPVRDLAAVEALGPQKASEIRRVLDLEWRERQALQSRAKSV
jgi:ERCC4-type nuclease